MKAGIRTSTPFGERRLLLHDRDLGLDPERVVGAHLGAEAVLERRDDPAARRVVLGVGAGHHEEVDRQADQVAADLDVLLLHDVEEADLDALGEVRQLVDREDAAVAARDEAVVDRELVGEVAALGDLDRVDLTDQVRDRDVRRGQLLPIPAFPRQPVDRRRVAALGDQVASLTRDGAVGAVVELRPGDDRDLLVEQVGKGAHEPALGLAPFAQQDQVLVGQDRVHHLRGHRVLVAEHARHHRHARGDRLGGVAAHLLGHRHRFPTPTRAGRRGNRGDRPEASAHPEVGSRRDRSARGRPWPKPKPRSSGASRRSVGPCGGTVRWDRAVDRAVGSGRAGRPRQGRAGPLRVTPMTRARSRGLPGGRAAGRPGRARGGRGHGRRAGPTRRCGSAWAR